MVVLLCEVLIQWLIPRQVIQPLCLTERHQRVKDADHFGEYLSFRLWGFIGQFHVKGEDVLFWFPEDTKCFYEVFFGLDVFGVS